MSEPVIQVENLSKRYRLGQFNARTWREEFQALFRHGHSGAAGDGDPHDFWALKDVSFEVQRGEVLGIIGRNGAGKSTLLKILSRITVPTSGLARIRGRVASLLEVGTGFHPELTGRDNIYLNGAIHGMSRGEIKTKFHEIVDFSGVETFLDTPVKRYSSGMYVRLAFAVAAHLEPEILIVDEVLAVGDEEFQQKCLGKMKSITGGGRTVIFVSHNLRAVGSLCSETIVLKDGCVEFIGPSAAAVNKYLRHGTEALRAKFAVKPGSPSITSIEVDRSELLLGNIVVKIEFISPYPLSPAIPGVVLYDEGGVPVFGSNPRIHSDNFEGKTINSGAIWFVARDIPLVRGKYFLSAWLGDWHKDYDCKTNALTIDFTPRRPLPRALPYSTGGSLNWPAEWKSSCSSEKNRGAARSNLDRGDD